MENSNLPGLSFCPGRRQSNTSIWHQITFKGVLFVLALATKPLYFRSSGSVQIADALFVLLFGVLIFSNSVAMQSIRERKWIAWFSICLLYQLTVNLFWYFRLQRTMGVDTSLLVSNLYYIFNYLVCLAIMQLRSIIGYQNTKKLFLLGTVLSMIVAVVGVALQYTGEDRATGTFNNPNQLGYFCILTLTIVTFFAKELKPVVRIPLIVSCIVLSLLSLSKASIVSVAILLFAYFINSRDRVGGAKLLSILISIVVVAVLIYVIMYADWEFLNSQPLIISLRQRLGAITTENDSSLATGRGYDRIKEIGAWIFTGAGEGMNDRFVTMKGKEVHSLYASFLVSYGVIGISMLSWIIGAAIFTKKRFARSLLCFSGVLAYCVTHNGIRSTTLWALLTMLLIEPAADQTQQSSAAAPGQPPQGGTA